MRRLNQLPLAFRWQGQLFFQPVQLHLALSDLLVELCLEGLLVALPLVTAYRENVGQLLLETMFPMANLRRMHPIGTGECVDRFEPFERFECHTGFELCTVLFPLCRHRSSPPLPLLLTQHSILITCPVFGVHYIPPVSDQCAVTAIGGGLRWPGTPRC